MITRGLFIVGTDTGVGKTFVTALAARAALRRGLSVGVYKPACSGATRDAAGAIVWEDVRSLEAAVECRFESQRICPQRFAAPLAPPVAARLEGRTVDGTLLREGAHWWEGRVELLLVEGVGGLLCPLTEQETVADLVRDLGYPLVIVSRLGLGTINHTLLTVEAAQRRNLPIAGILLNESTSANGDAAADTIAAETNEDEIARRCTAPILGVLRHGGLRGFERQRRRVEIDWLAVAQPACRGDSSSCPLVR